MKNKLKFYKNYSTSSNYLFIFIR